MKRKNILYDKGIKFNASLVSGNYEKLQLQNWIRDGNNNLTREESSGSELSIQKFFSGKSTKTELEFETQGNKRFAKRDGTSFPEELENSIDGIKRVANNSSRKAKSGAKDF